MVAGELSKLGSRYFITINLIDIQTGNLEMSSRDQCTCADDQLDQLAMLAGNRIRNHFGEALPVPSP